MRFSFLWQNEQFILIPTVCVSWGHENAKFILLFMWLKWGFSLWILKK